MELHDAKFQIFILCLENCYTVITIHYVGEVTLTCYWEMKENPDGHQVNSRKF